MKIEKFEKINKGKYRIYLENGEVLELYDEIIIKYQLLINQEISPSIYRQIENSNRLQEYYNACLKYISIRIRSTKEIEDYLKRKKIESEDIPIIIDKLQKAKYLDDDHFCECFIKDKLKFTTMGKYRIITELKKHNIENNIIDKYSNLMHDEIMKERIKTIIEKQIHSNHKLDVQKLRNRIYNSLLNLGYKSDLIVEILNQKL